MLHRTGGARIGALTLGLTGWAVAFFLLLDGNAPATLTGMQLGGVAMVAVVGVFGFSTEGARFRDHFFGVSAPESDTRLVFLTRIAGLVIGALTVSIVIELLVGDRTVGLQSVRSWVAGLTLAVALAPVTWWAYRKNLGRPKFPAGSPLRASNLDRRVRVAGQDADGLRGQLPGLRRLVPSAGVLVLIVSARWLREPWDLVALVAAILVGPGWVIWTRRSRTTDTGTSPQRD